MTTQKPTFKTVATLNYLDAIHYIEEKYNLLNESQAWKQYKDHEMSPSRCLWLFLCDSEFIKGNDTFVYINFPDMIEEGIWSDEDRAAYNHPPSTARDDRALELMKLLATEFDLYNNSDMLWEICW